MIDYIRFLADTDDSPYGALALAYLPALLRIAPVRIGTLTGGLSGPWHPGHQDDASPFSPLLATPMQGTYVNVVCCQPSRWTWVQRVPMPKRLASGELVLSDDVATGRQELYTAGVHNVLITAEAKRPTSEQLGAALAYEQIVNADLLSWRAWSVLRLRTGVEPFLFPPPVDDLRAFRSVIVP